MLYLVILVQELSVLESNSQVWFTFHTILLYSRVKIQSTVVSPAVGYVSRHLFSPEVAASLFLCNYIMSEWIFIDTQSRSLSKVRICDEEINAILIDYRETIKECRLEWVKDWSLSTRMGKKILVLTYANYERRKRLENLVSTRHKLLLICNKNLSEVVGGKRRNKN